MHEMDVFFVIFLSLHFSVQESLILYRISNYRTPLCPHSFIIFQTDMKMDFSESSALLT